MTRTKYSIILLIGVALFLANSNASAQRWNPSHSIGTVTGNYAFNYNQVPDQLVEVYQAAYPNTGLQYQWEWSPYPTTGFHPVSANGNLSSYSIPSPLTQTTYYRRKTIYPANGSSIYSNTIKIRMVSVNWEDINYFREHDVITTGVTSWTAVDQLPIGSKLQATTYLDGLGRPVQKVSRETATPPGGTNLWGDQVMTAQYDVFGRQSLYYLPYTTTTQSGKYKTSALSDQAAYYSNPATYNETSPYTSQSFDNSPLNRVLNTKEPGTSWAGSTGSSVNYDMNTTSDNVEVLSTDYVQGDAPVVGGVYPVNSLFKITNTDVNGNQDIQFIDKAGRVILKKVQSTPIPGTGDAGWNCTYSVYDDFGLLRFTIQPEGVKYLDANAWSFAGANGQAVLAEQVYQYNYDDKGRCTWKKAPGAAPINMVYDARDRLIFMQDGNQAALSTPQWTVDLYDELDRPVLTTLFNTTETIANLQSDLAGASQTTTINIANPANTGGPAVATTISLCPTSLNNTSLNTTITTSVLKYQFYDNYSFVYAAAFNTTYTNLSAYSTSDPNVMPIAASARSLNMVTGSLVRVLGTYSFLPTTQYYDEKGRKIQILHGNLRSGTDITTRQYHFDGHLMSVCNSHTNAGAGYNAFITLSKNVFDKLGRVISIQDQVGTNAMKTVASYDYDDIGRVVTKHLDPGYNNPNSGLPDLETLNYSYNIHSQLTGINKDYALKTPATYNKWGHFFGLYIGYDNRDHVFTRSQLGGQITGLVWSTQGDDAQRRYDYSYDNADRLINAAYVEQQHPGDGWSNSKMDFSVSGSSGQITYDNNGNLLTMLQKGVVPGTPAPITVDDLHYTYNTYSNKLQSVTDQMPTPANNGQFGDFKDGTNAAGTPDYVYDANGNVVVDLNKNAQSLNNGAPGTSGISYNYLDKPEQIRIVGQGTIKIVYSADGEKLQRVFIPESGAPSTITTYLDQYVYQETANLTLSSLPPFSGTGAHLTYINFEEGRIRAVTSTSTNNGYDALSESGNVVLPGTNMSGAWDYFIQDYQQNVRMILTEETHSGINQCTMETTRSAAEDPVFGQTGSGNEVEATRLVKPSAWTGNTSASVSHLGNLSGHVLGPNSLQKVMAGDVVTAQVQYYYPAPVTNSNPNIIPNVLANLTSLIGGNATAGTLTHANAANIGSQLNGTQAFVNAVEPDNTAGTTPQAYLTVLFFDERFNLIASTDGGVQQTQARATDAGNPNATPLTIPSVRAPRNGYVYIYVSNRSDQDVYFDNLSINITAGNIIEENHYYAFGLKIGAISSHKLGDPGEGKLSNPYQYNNKEQVDEDAGLNWLDYGFRNYDAQIGRFVQVDPITDNLGTVSPYHYAFNDPIANIDKNGLVPIFCPGTSALTIFLSNVGSAISNALEATEQTVSIISICVAVTNTGAQISKVISTSDVLNAQFTTIGAGPQKPGGTSPSGDNDDQGGGGWPSGNPLPIFWEEEGFPDIEEIDLEYYENFAPPGQKVDLPGNPTLVFLKFRYGGDAVTNSRESLKAYKGPKNPNGDLFNLHEVPYASTMEGGAKAIRRLASAKTNKTHGTLLKLFYKRNNLKPGDYFLVPLVKPKQPQPQPNPTPVLNPDMFKVPQRKPNNRPPILVPVLVTAGEAAETTAVVAEGFEAADLLWLLLFAL